ncbi:hypothetical protein Glove_101g27 [Diversispora epigaea]|uniref:Uncharacterized protein n=1 Tax=Diversispora epigaea TaxID=1348612 RepID=A0A397J898_9GLOM|nr:hypothetical protein Glove_101g27 [Diversispora epigaea]
MTAKLNQWCTKFPKFLQWCTKFPKFLQWCTKFYRAEKTKTIKRSSEGWKEEHAPPSYGCRTTIDRKEHQKDNEKLCLPRLWTPAIVKKNTAEDIPV